MLNVNDARAILRLAYNHEVHTGLEVPRISEVIVKLFAMFPELNTENHPDYIRRIVGLSIQGA